MLCVKVFQILLLGVTRDSSYNEQNAVWGGTPPIPPPKFNTFYLCKALGFSEKEAIRISPGTS